MTTQTHLIKKLNQSPVFCVSMSSIELFHSNFWEWLFKRKQVGILYLRIFFPNVDNIKEIKREFKHTDLYIETSNNEAFIIENKCKSLPREKQLIKYQEEFEQAFNKGVITGFLKPDFIRSLKKWKFMSYNNIAKRIIKIARNENNYYIKRLITDYANTLMTISLMIKKSTNGSDLFYIKSSSDLESVGLGDVAKKIKMSKFCKNIERDIKTKKPCDGWGLVIKQFFSNKEPGIDIRYERKIKDDISVIGIQIQNHCYRRVVQI